MVAHDRHTPLGQPVLEAEGILIPYNPSVITPAIEAAISRGRFEAEEASELPNIVDYGDRVLEIGAGIGFISTILDRNPKVSRVVAYEANPRLMPFMADLHALNGVSKVDRRNAVLTNDTDTSKTFYVRDDFWMGSLSEGPNPYREEIRVPTHSLNATLREEDITLIVCDIEGAETFLFDNVDFASVTRLYLELHDHVTGLAGVKSLFDAMGQRGFAYDPRHSSKSIVLFRKVAENEELRPYDG